MEISWGLVAPLIVLQIILMIVALVTCIKDEETNGPKWAWILVIILVNIFGPILYFLIGRKK
ncbi:PLD nuclease N-terminal domain-containing protein [Pueribacillus sp. YX66]|uniref:PLD nuclease N-terminal domain-containing protein n=1 Tax=Pueribacillus sp. YX66 TaxID=3229242 RepID=UPI00358D7275